MAPAAEPPGEVGHARQRERLRHRARRVQSRGLPKPALIGGAVAVVALIVGAIVFFGRGDKPAASTAAAPATATPRRRRRRPKR